MRTTLDLDEQLLRAAMTVAQAPTKTAAIEMGLRELLAKSAREQLAGLYGTDRKAKAPARRRLVRTS